MTTREFNITLPVSADKFGAWLELNHASLHVICMLGVFHVTITRHSVHSHYEDTDGVAISRTSDIEVTAHNKSFEAAIRAAVQKCQEEK